MSILVSKSIERVCRLMVKLDMSLHNLFVFLCLLGYLLVVVLVCVDKTKWIEHTIIAKNVNSKKIMVLFDTHLNFMAFLVV